MKFDEAIDKIDVNGTLVDTLGVLQALQQEYAPTVEMTELQREYWEKANGNNFKALDKKTTSGLLVGDMPDKKTTLTLTVRQSINAVLHPETIKVTDK